MREEYEIVEHPQIPDVKIFVVEMTYRSPHTHREFEICVVLSGEISIYTNQKTQVFRKGDLMIFNPYQMHELHSLTEKTMLLSVQISFGFCRKIFSEIRNLKFDHVELPAETFRSGQEFQHLWRLFLDSAILYMKRSRNYEFFCMGRLYEAFGMLLDTQPWHILSEKENTEYYNKVKRLGRITEYTEAHFTEKVLLSEVAQMENLSLSYLSHFFKEMLGISFQQYVALLRFERARKLVENTDRSLTEICMECGFSDYRYLNKIYQKQLGYTPQEYRSSHVRFAAERQTEEDLINTQTFMNAADSLKVLELAAQSNMLS
ncbi:MAG: AraC family transcriptional regulator [Lachnospiraceae bacterium]|nr:AraC family transcriptional regulator [Lachnospiraceae bacterium]